MTVEDFIKQIEGFSVDNYLEWFHGAFFKEYSFDEPFSLKMKGDVLKAYLKKTEKMEAQKELISLWELMKGKLKVEVINHSLFTIIQQYRTANIEASKRALEEKITMGIIPEMEVLENELLGCVPNLDMKILEWLKSPKPILKDSFAKVLYVFSIIDFGQYIHVRLKELKEGGNVDNVKKTNYNLPQKIQALKEIGFFELPKVVEMKGENRGQLDKILSSILNADETNTRKNVNALIKPNFKFDPNKHKGILVKMMGG